MQQALGKCHSQAASLLLHQTMLVFSSNSLVKIMKITDAMQYILTAAHSLHSHDYYNKSLIMILGLASVLFCEIDKMNHHLFKRKYFGGQGSQGRSQSNHR